MIFSFTVFFFPLQTHLSSHFSLTYFCYYHKVLRTINILVMTFVPNTSYWNPLSMVSNNPHVPFIPSPPGTPVSYLVKGPGPDGKKLDLLNTNFHKVLLLILIHPYTPLPNHISDFHALINFCIYLS